MLNVVVPTQISEINLEIPAAYEGAPKAQQGGQRKGNVIVPPNGTEKLKSGDITSIMRPKE
jgi:hypothetical protein